SLLFFFLYSTASPPPLHSFPTRRSSDLFLEHSAPPAPRMTVSDRLVEPSHPAFSGFVFKIQANMDPNHRDRIAFIRIVSGKFERSEEHTSELQSRENLVCRLLLEKKKIK